MIFEIKTHYAIYFILGYRYYLANHDVIRNYSYIPDSESFYEKFKRNKVINLALIPVKKVTGSFISKGFSSFDGEPLIEVIYSSKSDYLAISEDRTKIFTLHDYHKKSKLKIENDLENKLFHIVKFLYESSLHDSNPDLYKSFYGNIFDYLTEKKVSPYLPEYYHYMDRKKQNLMSAIFSCSGVGGLEAHNNLEGMNYLPGSQSVNVNKMIDWGNEFLYKIFRD